MKKSITYLTVSIFICLSTISCTGSNERVELNSTYPRYIRLIALANPLVGGEWMPTMKRGLSKDYTAQDIIEIIADLKPQVLERFITGYQNADKLVPVRDGEPPMTTLEFLNAAMRAGSEGCYIIPKLNLQWLQTENGRKLFWESAQKLYDMPLETPIRSINLDCWDKYVSSIDTTEAMRNALFKRLRDIGYEEIGVNLTGKANVNNRNIDYADFNVNKDYTVNLKTLSKIQSYENIKQIFLYIDYPSPMEIFSKMDPDKQADIYVRNIYPLQSEGFTFVYAIIQDFWDAHDYVTSSNGPYGGKTMYDITKELLQK